MNINKGIDKLRKLKRLTAFRGSTTKDVYFDNDECEKWDECLQELTLENQKAALDALPDCPPEDDEEGSSEWKMMLLAANERAQDKAREATGDRPLGDLIRIHKAYAPKSIPVATRMLGLFSEDLFQLFAHDEDQDPDGVSLSDLFDSSLSDEEKLKSFFVLKVLPELEDKLMLLTEESRGMHWMMATLLDGNIEVDGGRFTVQEMEESGASFAQLIKMFWAAVMLAMFPGRGAPATKDGSQGPEAPEKSQAPRTLNSDEEIVKITGQSVPMSMNVG